MILIKQKPTYIRTKDGHIFEIEKDLGKYGKSKAVIICDFDGNYIDVEKQNMILKQANTIEELCDEFVIDCETHHVVYHDLEWAKSKAQRFNGKFIIYGAIWTDKGLIYKAKMKGVLPNGEIDWELL